MDYDELNFLKFTIRGEPKMFKNFPDVVNVADLQKMLGIGRNSAYNLLKENKISSIRIGRTHKIPKKNVVKYLQSNR